MFGSRLFSKRGNIKHPILFIFDVLFLIDLYFSVQAIHDIAKFSSQEDIVTIGRAEFGLIGSLGFYGIRLASYIAIVRKNRSPQPIEWSVCLVGLVVGFLSVSLSGEMAIIYAGFQKYRFCHSVGDRNGQYVFHRNDIVCPPTGTSH